MPVPVIVTVGDTAVNIASAAADRYGVDTVGDSAVAIESAEAGETDTELSVTVGDSAVAIASAVAGVIEP